MWATGASRRRRLNWRRFPPSDQREELANIDCLTCHQEVYKRFPDWVLPDDPNFAGGESYGFEDLVLENVALDASGNLIPSVGSTVTRTGFAGIPNVDLTRSTSGSVRLGRRAA